MNEMMCDAHNLLEKELTRIKDNQAELYSLDRQRQQKIAGIQSDVTVIKTKQAQMEQDIKELDLKVTQTNEKVQTVDTKVETINIKVDEMSQDVKFLTQKMCEKKWTPKDKAPIIVALISLLGTIIVALLK